MSGVWPRVYPFWAMGRPLFLLGTLPLYLMGAAAAWYDGYGPEPVVLALGMLLVWLVQLMTHYNNEYCDLKTDEATQVSTRISGGSRVLVRGLVPKRTARTAAVASLSLAVALSVTLTTALGAGNLLFVFAGAALSVGWSYSAPPLRLESRGFGEIAIALVTAFLLPSTAYYIQSATLSLSLLLACVPLAFIALALTMATGLPDLSADMATGKMTLVAKLGHKRALWLHITILTMGWLACNLWIVSLWPSLGWIGIAGSVPFMAVVAASIKDSTKGQLEAMERMGIAEGMLLAWMALSIGTRFAFS